MSEHLEYFLDHLVPDSEPQPQLEPTISRHHKTLLILAGTTSVILGVIGIFVPILPTTPFFLLAAACYARSSQRLYHWILHQRVIGRYIQDYRLGKGVPVSVKLTTLVLLWVTIGYSAFFVVHVFWLRLLLFGIATGVSIHIYMIRPRYPKKKSNA